MQETLFDLLPNAEDFKPVKSNDWKWTMANDYPKEKNGKVNHIGFNVYTVGYFGDIGSFKLAKSDFYIAIWLALAGDSILCNSSNFLFFCKRFTQIVDKGEFRSYNKSTLYGVQTK